MPHRPTGGHRVPRPIPTAFHPGTRCRTTDRPRRREPRRHRGNARRRTSAARVPRPARPRPPGWCEPGPGKGGVVGDGPRAGVARGRVEPHEVATRVRPDHAVETDDDARRLQRTRGEHLDTGSHERLRVAQQGARARSHDEEATCEREEEHHHEEEPGEPQGRGGPGRPARPGDERPSGLGRRGDAGHDLVAQASAVDARGAAGERGLDDRRR